ncbi:GGDEF domain-containing protein [[Clostridium] polysaccharolyticum]|uniref:Diguanylate cyclase (GGDEF) domain-containing protein n=1 Tax=[Clostridium] polysaccharolyticum TaxID=29364 RepID=A0A1I0CT09_9FIRM|nr:GGDEF domain-containing protein [[Clostridium] polysaccharolyticum]SET22668.1 diguanylate cyclase (GGDEF) domain-containing protein [[Clostridium] polysaccharolyticum]
MKKGLTTAQLEVAAILAMLCEHLSWITFNFYTPQAHFMRIVGKLAIPIICYLSVSFYEKAKNITKYILCLLLFWGLSIYPYHIFYTAKITGKQNIIFDVLLGFLVMAILDSLKLKKIWKVILIAAILILSICFSNNPLIFILFMADFRHSHSYNRMVRTIIKIAAAAVLFTLISQSICQSAGAYVSREAWKESVNYIGFLLAIPLLKKCQLRKKEEVVKGYFLIVYPIQFLLLKNFVHITSGNFYRIYLYIHLLGILIVLRLGYSTLKAKLSHVQTANIVMLSFALLFMLGYYFQLTAFSLQVMIAAVKIEMTGLTGMIIGFTWFMNEFCNNPISNFVYIVEGMVTSACIYAIYTLGQNKLFYKAVGVKHFKEHSIIVSVRGPVWILFFAYMAMIMLLTLFMCLYKMKHSDGIERRQSVTLLIAEGAGFVLLMLRIILRNEEYDVGTFAVFSFVLLFSFSICQNDYLDNIQTERERDPLTGLCNRGYFIEQVQKKLEKKIKGTMFMIDMDNFKMVNDNYGHGTGDKVLIALADSLKQVMGSDNFVSRIGGDEFCIFIHSHIDENEMKKITERLEVKFHKNLEQRNLNLLSTLSVGIARYDGKGKISFEELYENADKALYLAKNSGKSQYKFYA